jgi:hypothetical protein
MAVILSLGNVSHCFITLPIYEMRVNLLVASALKTVSGNNISPGVDG